jgi:hypothetical protein
MAVPAAAFAWRDRLALGVSGFFVLPAIALAQVVIQNAAVVLFPGWVAVGPSRPRGVEAMGQQMLMFAGTFLLLVVGLLPGTAVGLVIGVIAFPWVGWVSLLPGAAILSLLLVAECVLAVHVLGRVLDRTDPVAIDG